MAGPKDTKSSGNRNKKGNIAAQKHSNFKKPNLKSSLQDGTGSITKDTVDSSKFNKSIDYSNRDIANNPAIVRQMNSVQDKNLAYAYDDMKEVDKAPSNTKGAPSIFNDLAIVVHRQYNNKNDFFDTDGKSGPYDKASREYTIDSLLRDFPSKNEKIDSKGTVQNVVSTKPYFRSDFLMTKWSRILPINHMITLRRFPFPTYDNLKFDGGRQFKPIAQAVAYFGADTENSLAELSKFAGGINWEKLEAKENEVEGNEKGFDDTPFMDDLKGSKMKIPFTGKSVNGNTVAQGLKHATGLEQPRGQTSLYDLDQQARLRMAQDINYTNKVLGPVNVITSTHIRARGIQADQQQISITFEYDLGSYNGMNPKIAMLDLMCNMLALCYNNAKFWGGVNRYYPDLKSQQHSFLGKQDLFYAGDYSGYISSVVDDLGKTANGGGMNMLGGMIQSVLNGDFKQAFNKLGGVAKGITDYVGDLKLAKSRPKVIGFKALLTGLPIGEWHMVVGNPYKPIMTMGNLICESFDFSYDGELSVDDFPTKLKFVINLKHGRPRDKGDLESIFAEGQRIYHPSKGVADVANMSAATETVFTKKSSTSKVGNDKNKNYFDKEKSAPPLMVAHGNQSLEFMKFANGTTY